MLKVDFKFNNLPIMQKSKEIQSNTFGEKICFKGKLTEDKFQSGPDEYISPRKRYMNVLTSIIKDNPRLSKKEEIVAIKEYRALRDSKNPDDNEKAYELRNKIANSFLKTIIHFAKKYETNARSASIDFEELIDEGYLGAYEYINKGNIDKLETTPDYNIFGNMLKLINSRKNLLNLSNYAQQAVSKAKKMKDKISNSETPTENLTKKDDKFARISKMSKNFVLIDDPNVYMQLADNNEPEFPELTQELMEFINRLSAVRKDLLLTKAEVEEKDGNFIEIENPASSLNEYNERIAKKHGCKPNRMRELRRILHTKLPTIKGYRELANKAGLPAEINRTILIEEFKKLARSGKTQIAEKLIYANPALTDMEKDCIVLKHLKRKTLGEIQKDFGYMNANEIADIALTKIGYIDMLGKLKAEKVTL